MLKEQKGITLVALIITIIVMLILAGVSISLVIGEEGVLSKAQSVEPAQVEGALKEAVALANADMIAEYYSDTADYAEAYAETAAKGKIVDRIVANYSYATEYPIEQDAVSSLEGETTLTVKVKGVEKSVKVDVEMTEYGYYKVEVVD